MYLLFWLKNHYIAQVSLELGLYSCPITLSPKKWPQKLFLIENKFLYNIFWSCLHTHNSSQSLFTDPNPLSLSLFLFFSKNQAGNNKMINSVTVKTSRKRDRKCTENTCRHRDTHICSCGSPTKHKTRNHNIWAKVRLENIPQTTHCETKILQNSIELILCWLLCCWAWGLPLHVICITSEKSEN